MVSTSTIRPRTSNSSRQVPSPNTDTHPRQLVPPCRAPLPHTRLNNGRPQRTNDSSDSPSWAGGQRLGGSVPPAQHRPSQRSRYAGEAVDPSSPRIGNALQLEGVGAPAGVAVGRRADVVQAEEVCVDEVPMNEAGRRTDTDEGDLDILDSDSESVINPEHDTGSDGARRDKGKARANIPATGDLASSLTTDTTIRPRTVAPRRISRRQQQLEDCMRTLSVTPPPSTQNRRRDQSSSPIGGGKEPLFDPIEEEDEGAGSREVEVDGEIQSGEDQEGHRISNTEGATGSAARAGQERNSQGGSGDEVRAQSRSGEQAAVKRSSAMNACVTTGYVDGERDGSGRQSLIIDVSDDDDDDIKIIDNPTASQRAARGRSSRSRETSKVRQVPVLDLTQESDDEDEIDKPEPTLPPTPAYMRDREFKRDMSVDSLDEHRTRQGRMPSPSPIPPALLQEVGMDEADFVAAQHIAFNDRNTPMPSAHVLPQLSFTQDRRRADEGYRATHLANRPRMLPGDGAPAMDYPRPVGSPLAFRTRRYSPLENALPALSIADTQALAQALSINSSGSRASSGPSRMPALAGRRPACRSGSVQSNIFDELDRLERRDASRASSYSSSTSSGKRKRQALEDIEEDNKDFLDIKREDDLRVVGEQLDLPEVGEIDRIANAEFVKVELGSEVVYELVFQRFIILAILRHHNTPEDTIDNLLQRPYFAVPRERLGEALRGAAVYHWGKSGSRDKQRNDRFEPRRWTHQLRHLPYMDADPLADCTGEMCALCGRTHGNRLHYAAVFLKGHHYDDVTLTDGAREEKKHNVGTSCRKIAEEGHRLFHTLYRAYYIFEAEYFSERLQQDPSLAVLVNTRDVNGVTAYFRSDRRTGNVVNDMRLQGEGYRSRSRKYSQSPTPPSPPKARSGSTSDFARPSVGNSPKINHVLINQTIANIKLGYERYMKSNRLTAARFALFVRGLM